jgi:hypothetical protein
MSYKKPFHRNYRKIKEGYNSGYSDWAYIIDPDYAQHPEHYTRAFSIIQDYIVKLFEYIEPSDTNSKTYSFRIHELLMRTCIEVEANFKAIFRENIYTPTTRTGALIHDKNWNIDHFKKINNTHHLDAYSVELPFWKGSDRIRKPFLEWRSEPSLSWYKAYNQAKHDRLNNFEQACFGTLIDAYSGLFVLLSSQFKDNGFSPGNPVMGLSGGNYGIGGFLMVEFPDNWTEDETYDFDWSVLRKETDRFERIDYNTI